VCGLGGYLGDPHRPRPLRVEALTLRHRGPDDQRSLPLAAADGMPGLLAFARLAIVDLSPLGRQPMQSDDGALALLYNGETYNAPALRDELVAAGRTLRSRSDTEVVLRAYEAHGAAAFCRLHGMYALALWDGRRQELLLARDPLGIKPLYYCYADGRLVFASEVRALLSAGAVAPRLDPRAVHGYLSLGAVPEPRTLVAGVQALPPGYLLRAVVQGGRVLPPALERIGPPPTARPPQFLTAAGRALPRDLAGKAQVLAPRLADTVADHLLADVPVAVLLSGGVDSTAVAALAQKAAPSLASFTLTYGDDDPHSEAAVARRTAQALGLSHHDCVVTADAALAALPRFLAAQDQPSIDGYNTFLISEQVRAAGYKVALSGLGGDELFHGYGLHHAFAAAWLLGELVGGVPAGPAALGALARLGQAAADAPWAAGSPGRSAASGRLHKLAALVAATAWPRGDRAVALYTRLRMLWSPAEVAALLAADPAVGGLSPETHVPLPGELLAALGAEASAPESADRSLRAQIRLAYHVVMQLERHAYLRDTLLRDADALSMAHGVELRVPLCDATLWQAVTDLGPEPTRRPKELLVAASRQPLVAEAAARRKRGFALPLGRWLRGELRDPVSARLNDAALCRRAGLTAAAPRAWARYLDHRDERLLYRVWSLFTLLAYVERHGLQV
jgi:asparagine synthase (glutamine-hydrolysing)